MRQDATLARLLELERTIGRLNGQLQSMRGELQRAQMASIGACFGWTRINPGQVFMSAVCNRRIRPNRKVHHEHRAA